MTLMECIAAYENARQEDYCHYFDFTDADWRVLSEAIRQAGMDTFAPDRAASYHLKALGAWARDKAKIAGASHKHLYVALAGSAERLSACLLRHAGTAERQSLLHDTLTCLESVAGLHRTIR